MNTRTRGIVIMLISVGILIGAYGLYKSRAPISPKEEAVGNVVSTSTGVVVKSETKTNRAGTPQASAPRDLWSTFALYLARAHDHDIAGVAELSYALSDTCKDPKQKAECYKKMDTVYDIGSTLKQEDFTHSVEDSKQGILSTDIRRPDTVNTLVAIKQVIYFTKDAQGNPKLLALNPNEMWQVERNKASSTAELEAKLAGLTKDSDEDGASDELENCIFPDNILQISCKKTNPLKKDSNGDGWWDGIRPLITQ